MEKRKKKKFKDTTVGKILRGAVGIINPTLGNVLDGALSVEDAIKGITEADASPEEKIRAKELILEAYEAEVSDRIAARNREAMVAASGGTDILFKTIGWTISLSFLLVVLYGIGIIPPQPDLDHDYLMFASGSVTSAFMAVVSYYFGSSLGSKQKTAIMDGKS